MPIGGGAKIPRDVASPMAAYMAALMAVIAICRGVKKLLASLCS
jgi:hypothetical protein